MIRDYENFETLENILNKRGEENIGYEESELLEAFSNII